MFEKKISVIIRPTERNDMLAKPPVTVNGRNFDYVYDKAIELPEEVVEAIENTFHGPKVERLPIEGSDADGVAEGQGGADGDPDTDGEDSDDPEQEDPAAKFDGDGDGKPGGSVPEDPPALSDKTKDELIAIAEAEGADLSKASNNDERREAIEANRALSEG